LAGDLSLLNNSGIRVFIVIDTSVCTASLYGKRSANHVNETVILNKNIPEP